MYVQKVLVNYFVKLARSVESVGLVARISDLFVYEFLMLKVSSNRASSTITGNSI